jgi:hypothetical protein
MKIALIGSGNIGGTLARLFTNAGHAVALANSRGPESLREFVAELGPQVQALDVEAAAAFGDVVILATPWRLPEALPRPETVAGKIVVDAMNPYAAGGGLVDLGDSTSSEETLKRLPGARLVKAFNTIYFKHLAANGDIDQPLPERHAIFMAGDDIDAKRVVMNLIEEIGFAPVDTGTLREGGRRQQPGSEIYNRPMSGADAEVTVSRWPDAD